MINSNDVKKIASLAQLTLREAEVEQLSGQLSQILNYVETLNRLDLADVKPTSHAVSVSNVFREDEPKISHIIDEAIGQGPEHEGRFFRVPKVIE